MKRIMALVLTLVLCLGCVSALAETWYCPECGQSNSGNFCSNCGTKKPTSTVTSTSGGPTVTSVDLESDGSVSIRWTGGTAPYRIDYQGYVNANYNSGADVIRWNAVTYQYSTSARLESDLVPGERYWITVTDNNGKQGWYDYNPTIRAFTTVSGMRLTFSLRQRRNNRSSTVNSFSGNEMRKDYMSSIYGATIKISTSHLNQDYSFYVRMAVILPSGEPLLFHYTYEDFLKRWGYVYWETYDFKNVWSTLMAEKGTIPSGTYTYKIFFDNTILGEARFNIN